MTMDTNKLFKPTHGELADNGKWWYPTGKPTFQQLVGRRTLLDDIKVILNRIYDNDCFVAGGFVRWYTSIDPRPVPHGDIDVFGLNENSVEKFISVLEEEPFAHKVAESEWATTYEWGGYKINLIKAEMDPIYRTFGEPAEVVTRFDLTVTLGWLERDGTRFKPFGSKHMITDDHSKTIRFNLIKHPSSSIRRIAKYAAKGYTCPVKEVIRVMKVTLAYQEEIDDYLSWLQGDTLHTRNEIKTMYMSL